MVAQPADDNQPPPAPTEPSWEEKLRLQELKAARMRIEWNLPPRPGPQQGGGAPSKGRIWRLLLWAFFDETVRKEGTEPTPALIPHQLPQALQVGQLTTKRCLGWLRSNATEVLTQGSDSLAEIWALYDYEPQYFWWYYGESPGLH